MIQYSVAAVLNPQPNGQYTYTLPWPNSYVRQDGTPSQQGDVCSVQPNGTIQARPIGTALSWELCSLQGVALVFTGAGNTVILLPSDK